MTSTVRVAGVLYRKHTRLIAGIVGWCQRFLPAFWCATISRVLPGAYL